MASAGPFFIFMDSQKVGTDTNRDHHHGVRVSRLNDESINEKESSCMDVVRKVSDGFVMQGIVRSHRLQGKSVLHRPHRTD